MYKHPADLISELEKLEGPGSVKAKKKLVLDYFQHEEQDGRKPTETEFYQTVKYAFDPWMNFFTTTIPGLNEVSVSAKRAEKERQGGRYDLFETTTKTLPWKQQFVTMFNLLDRMASRQLPPNSGESRNAVLEWAKAVGPGTISVFRKILNKDLRCGMKASSFNKIVPGWIAEFKLSLAKPFDHKNLKFPCWVDPKFDGERCLAFISSDGSSGSVSYYSRQGNEFHNLRVFDTHLLSVFKGRGCIVADCEVVNRQGFQTLQKTPKYYDPTFDPSHLMLVVFDWLPQDAFSKQFYDEPQTDRYRSLKSLFANFNSDKVVCVDSRIANNFEEAEQLFVHWIDQGLEGIIMKQLDGEYHFSTNSRRNPGWMKMKGKETADLEIVGMAFGDKDARWHNKCGSLLVKRKHGDKDVIVSVGGGLTDHDHETIVEDGDQLLWTSPEGEVVNIKGRLIEVIYDSVTEKGSLRFPRIKRRSTLFRTDK